MPLYPKRSFSSTNPSGGANRECGNSSAKATAIA
jgi:hypothetical protein